MRCGECLSIFDALEELRSADTLDDSAVHAPTRVESPIEGAQTNQHAGLDVTYSDFDLFSEEADLPEIAYFDQTRDTPDFDFDAVELGNDETFSDTLFVHDVTIDADATALRAKPLQTETKSSATDYAEIDFVADTQPPEPLIFKYREEQDRAEQAAGEAEKTTVTQAAEAPAATPPKRPYSEPETEQQAVALEAPRESSPWLFRAGMFVLLAALLGGLFAYRTRPQLYNNSTMRPVLEAGCKIVRCTIPARVDIASLKMVKRNVYSHPNTPNALVVNVSFRNEADFDQRLPVLHMVLSNRVGRTVSKQDFSPPSYMQNWEEGAVIKANQQLDVKLEITDPGRDAQSFEFYFSEFRT